MRRNVPIHASHDSPSRKFTRNRLVPTGSSRNVWFQCDLRLFYSVRQFAGRLFPTSLFYGNLHKPNRSPRQGLTSLGMAAQSV